MLAKRLTPVFLPLALVACATLATPGRAPRVDAPAPGFVLTSQHDVTIRLRRLLEASPVVVVFYRGHW